MRTPCIDFVKTAIKKSLCPAKRNAPYYFAGWVFPDENGDLRPNNWGDDINKFFFEYVTGRKFSPISIFDLSAPKKESLYLMIGSIITHYPIADTIIYGTGVKDPDGEIFGQPKKIISVRGPLSRSALINRGIDCPERYGDPALLIPVFYSPPPLAHKSLVGIILNVETEKEKAEPIIKQLEKIYDCKIISMTDYAKWTDVIDEICSCRFVISESLHGLIIAETYGVPNVWVEFKEHVGYWDFKYNDFYASIQKECQIFRLWKMTDFTVLEDEANSWKQGKIDYRSMLSAFPFKPKRKFAKSVKKFSR